MPTRFLPKDWYQLTGALATIFLLFVVVSLYDGYRINQAEKRINYNSQANEAQNVKRAQLVASFRRADRHACLLINNLRAQNRADARRTFKRLALNVRLLHLTLTPEIKRIAKSERDRVLRINKPIDCSGRD